MNFILNEPLSRLPNARMLNVWLNIKNNCSMKKKKIGECHATAYGFLHLWYKYEPRKYSHYVIFTFCAINTFLPNSGTPILREM